MLMRASALMMRRAGVRAARRAAALRSAQRYAADMLRRDIIHHRHQYDKIFTLAQRARRDVYYDDIVARRAMRCASAAFHIDDLIIFDCRFDAFAATPRSGMAGASPSRHLHAQQHVDYAVDIAFHATPPLRHAPLLLSATAPLPSRRAVLFFVYAAAYAMTMLLLMLMLFHDNADADVAFDYQYH